MGHWSDAFVGQPYVEGAQDCAAIAERVRREVFGAEVRLPSERRPGPSGRMAQLAQGLRDFGIRTDSPVDGDAVLLQVRGRLQHLGLYCLIYGEAWVMHNSDGFGSVIRTRLRDIPDRGYRIEGYYRWK